MNECRAEIRFPAVNERTERRRPERQFNNCWNKGPGMLSEPRLGQSDVNLRLCFNQTTQCCKSVYLPQSCVLCSSLFPMPLGSFPLPLQAKEKIKRRDRIMQLGGNV